MNFLMMLARLGVKRPSRGLFFGAEAPAGNRASRVMKICRCFFIVTFLSFIACFGCNKGNLSGLVSCEGQVTYQGSPCAGAQIQFAPKSGESGRTAIGKTDSNGHFSMRTLQPNDGAYPGEYSVAVTKYEFVGPEPEVKIEDNPTKEQPGRPQENKLPKKYANPQTSGLTITVPAGGKKDMLFELTEK